MNAIDLLEAQHRRIKDLFRQYVDEARDPEHKQQLFNQIADELAAHGRIEEKLFYPAINLGEANREVGEAVHDHLDMKQVIVELMDLRPTDPEFDGRVNILRNVVERHLRHEEISIFHEARVLYTAQVLESLGAAMKADHERLCKGHPRLEMRAELDTATGAKPPHLAVGTI